MYEKLLNEGVQLRNQEIQQKNQKPISSLLNAKIIHPSNANSSALVSQEDSESSKTKIIGETKALMETFIKGIKNAIEIKLNRTLILLNSPIHSSRGKMVEIIKDIFDKYFFIEFITNIVNNPMKTPIVVLSWDKKNSKILRQIFDKVPLTYETYNNKARKANQFCDCTFVIDNQTFHAHKVILSKKSEYFNSMFTGSYKESTVNDPIPYGSGSITAPLFGAILEFIYTGYISLIDKTVSEVIILAEEAKLLQLKRLEWLCQFSLCSSMNPQNFIEIADYASPLQEKNQLKVHSKSFITLHPETEKCIEQKIVPQEIDSLSHLYCLVSYYKLPVLKDKIKTIISDNLNEDSFKKYCDHGATLPSGELRNLFHMTCSHFAQQNSSWLKKEENGEIKKSYELLLSCVQY